jgi:hypothetical protein
MLHARATEVLVCHSLVAAAALVVERGRAVLDAPRPRCSLPKKLGRR